MEHCPFEVGRIGSLQLIANCSCLRGGPHTLPQQECLLFSSKIQNSGAHQCVFQRKALVNDCLHYEAFNRFNNKQLVELFTRKRTYHFLAISISLQAFVKASCREDWRVDKCRFGATNFCPECRKMNRRFHRCWRRVSCCSRSPCPPPVI